MVVCQRCCPCFFQDEETQSDANSAFTKGENVSPNVASEQENPPAATGVVATVKRGVATVKRVLSRSSPQEAAKAKAKAKAKPDDWWQRNNPAQELPAVAKAEVANAETKQPSGWAMKPLQEKRASYGLQPEETYTMEDLNMKLPDIARPEVQLPQPGKPGSVLGHEDAMFRTGVELLYSCINKGGLVKEQVPEHLSHGSGSFIKGVLSGTRHLKSTQDAEISGAQRDIRLFSFRQLLQMRLKLRDFATPLNVGSSSNAQDAFMKELNTHLLVKLAYELVKGKDVEELELEEKSRFGRYLILAVAAHEAFERKPGAEVSTSWWAYTSPAGPKVYFDASVASVFSVSEDFPEGSFSVRKEFPEGGCFIVDRENSKPGENANRLKIEWKVVHLLTEV